MKNETYFETYEPDVEGRYTLTDMVKLYKEHVDKSIFQDFNIWLYDMIRSGIFVKRER